MQFSCGQCSTRYAVPDDKVRGKRIRTKCRKCGAEIVVDGTSLGGDAPPPSAVPAPAPQHRPTPHAGTTAQGRVEEPWTVAISRSDQRRMVTAEVVEAYAAGTITDTTLVWKQGMQKWQPPFDIPAIALALLARGLEPKPKVTDQRAKTEPPPAPAASSASDWEDEATRVFDAAVVAEDMIAPKPPAAGSSAGWDDEDEATKMFAPDRALLGRRLPRATASAKPQPTGSPKAKPQTPAPPKVAPPGSLRSRPPPVPPRRSKPPGATSVRPPAAASSGVPLTNARTVAVGEGEKPPVPTIRPPPGAATEDPFAFEDEATAVITADRARALLEEQLPGASGEKSPVMDETPMAFGTDSESSPGADGAGSRTANARDAVVPRAKRDSVRSYDDLVEKGPTVVVAGSERTSSVPPPPRSPLPPVPTPPPSGRPSGREFAGIQHERTRVVRARKKPGGPIFWLALVVALGTAAFAGYYASRLLDSQRPVAPEQPR
jgi:predicted Zn finger-like uncharacterized protein